ncbi:MAG: FtsX-like permease family protein [Bacteroidaceae bacterium]|nr:FtsX-like permease family protein [Bacteroidaceae bacterium]
MNRASRSYYKRFYRLAAAAVTVMMTVLTGSLVLGDSVRGSLRDRVNERLGETVTIVNTGNGFLNDTILHNDLLRSAKGFLVCEGFVSTTDNKGNAKMIPVTVWGDTIGSHKAQVNEALSKHIGTESFVLHLPSNSLVPRGALFVSQTHTSTLRITSHTVRKSKDGGNLLLRNEQVRPLNVFVNRQQLAEAMDLDGKSVNVILSPKEFTVSDFQQIWEPSFSGIIAKGDTIGTSRLFLPTNIVNLMEPEQRYMAYFVNTIGNTHGSEISYSFVTATDELKGDNTVLSDEASRRLGVNVGDSVTMDYYVVTKGLKRLETRSHRFVVSNIVSTLQMAGDSLLTASFPGLSGVAKCTDWDSDLPIDMSRITKADEDYWSQWRQTPKALVSFDAVGEDWCSDFGAATKVIASSEQIEKIKPEDMGLSVIQPRQQALYAASNGTDFAGLFLALGFFIILAAILLMANPLLEMLSVRSDEVSLFNTLGFSKKAIRQRFIREVAPMLLIPTLIGLLLGLGYAFLMLRMLAGAWNGATHTDGFTLRVTPQTLLISWIAGTTICLVTLVILINKEISRQMLSISGSEQPTIWAKNPAIWAKKKNLFPKEKNFSSYEKTASSRKRVFYLLLLMICALIVLNFAIFHSVVVFVLCGLLWIVDASIGGRILLTKASLSANDLEQLPLLNIRHFKRQHTLAFWTLATGIFTVFAVGLNRPDIKHSSHEATGGYSLYAETAVPLLYDMNDIRSRRHLHLEELPHDVRFLQMPKHTEDEASCWNLNKVSIPSVLGMETSQMAAFGIDVDKLMLNAEEDNIVPVAIDVEALTWSMMKKVGDTLTFKANDGHEAKALIAASYPTGVLHGYAIMPQEQFLLLWPEESGSRVFMAGRKPNPETLLTKIDNESTAQLNTTQQLLETALSDYGISLNSTDDRLRRFYEVTDAYLSIFLSLGGLGLLLGLASLLIVVRKSLAARRQEIALYQTLGFSTQSIVGMLRKEQLIVPLFAILTGALGSVVSISAGIREISTSAWTVALALLALFGIITWIIIHLIINTKTIRQ